MKTLRTLIGLAAITALSTTMLNAQSVTVDDFLPPARGGATEVKQPAVVKDTGDVITAASAQDAVFAAMEANVDDLKDAPKPEADNVGNAAAADSSLTEIGAHFVKFPSGEGIVATGMSVYNTMPNPNASRVAQRNSFVIAYTRAKQAMVQLLGETSTEGRTILTDISNTIEDNTQSSAEGKTTVDESIQQAGNALLKGYVVLSLIHI